MAIQVLQQKYVSAISKFALDEYNEGVATYSKDYLTLAEASHKVEQAAADYIADLTAAVDAAWNAQKDEVKEGFINGQWVFNDYLANYGIEDLVSAEDFFAAVQEEIDAITGTEFEY